MRTLILSDIHVGSRQRRVERFNEVLVREPCEESEK